MCVRTVFWEDTGKDPQKKTAQNNNGPLACEQKAGPQASQTAPDRRPLPPLIDGCLDFLKGMSGFKPSAN